jgi:general secretion pathway protein D
LNSRISPCFAGWRGRWQPLVVSALLVFAAHGQTPGVPEPITPSPVNPKGSHRNTPIRKYSATATNAANSVRPQAQIPPAPVPVPAPVTPTAGPAVPSSTAAAAAVDPGPQPAYGPATPPPAAGAASTNPEMMPPNMIDFRNADLAMVLDVYAMMVNRTLLRPATLPAQTLSLKTQGQLTMKEGIQALEGVLALNGITIINVGDKFAKVLAEAQATQGAAPFATNGVSSLPDLGQYVTEVKHLQYVKPSEVVAILQPFVRIPNGILPIDPSGIIILRDYAENVKRMLELLNRVDIALPSDFEQEVIPIKYAKSSEIASALNSLSAGGGGGTTVGTSSGGGSGSSSGRSSMGSRSGSRMGGSMGGAGGFGNNTGSNPFGNNGGFNNQGGNFGSGGQGGNSFNSRLQNIINRASSTTSSGDIQVLGTTKIISDERTNSLLVFASKEDMRKIKEIVSKLDVVLAQVLIEAVIISVGLTDSHDLGFSYLQHPQTVGNWTGVGAINNKSFQTPANYVLNKNGVTNSSSSVIPGGFSYLMSFGDDLDVAVAAVQGNSRARILQRPRIQTSHNEPASIFVGESRPYPTSSYYGGGAYGGYSSIQQLEIGVSLDVTPLINPDGLVVMDIHQKIDSFEGNVTIQNVGDVPITSEKEAQAKVSVRDHDTIILGGLIETDKNANKSGVPFLMDLPLFGYLFRSTHHDEKRTELIVLIRPTVLPTPEIAALTATAEKNKMPAVRAAERDFRAEETQRLKKANAEDQKAPLQQMAPP